jgi:hypothetical protein
MFQQRPGPAPGRHSRHAGPGRACSSGQDAGRTCRLRPCRREYAPASRGHRTWGRGMVRAHGLPREREGFREGVSQRTAGPMATEKVKAPIYAGISGLRRYHPRSRRSCRCTRSTSKHRDQLYGGGCPCRCRPSRWGCTAQDRADTPCVKLTRRESGFRALRLSKFVQVSTVRDGISRAFWTGVLRVFPGKSAISSIQLS